MKMNEIISAKDLLSTATSPITNLGKRVSNNVATIKNELWPRIKEIVGEESKGTAKMWEIYLKWNEASDEERKFANDQIISLLKTAGLAGMVLLPGTVLVLPSLVKMSKKMGMNILPKWSRRRDDNEIT